MRQLWSKQLARQTLGQLRSKQERAAEAARNGNERSQDDALFLAESEQALLFQRCGGGRRIVRKTPGE